MTRHVALLRAVNVGGRGKIAMSALRGVAEAIGLTEVATVLQSGNVTFFAEGECPALERRLEAALKSELGLETEVVVRSAASWRQAIAGNPFPGEAQADPSHLVLLVGKGDMNGEAVDTLQAAIKGRERVAVLGDVAYVLYPDGIGRSKLTHALLERHLATPATGRNWNTVGKIADLLGVGAGLSA